MADEDIGLSLPKSTMTRVIKDRLPSNMGIAADAREIIIRCCQNFVQLLSATSNELSERENRSTITPEHILQSLKDLGFEPYIEDLTAALEEWKAEKKEERNAAREKRAAKNNPGMSTQEMIELQQRLFQQAKERSLAAPPQADPAGPSNANAAAEAEEAREETHPAAASVPDNALPAAIAQVPDTAAP